MSAYVLNNNTYEKDIVNTENLYIECFNINVNKHENTNFYNIL